MSQILVFLPAAAPSLFAGLVADGVELGMLLAFCLQTIAVWQWSANNLSSGASWDRTIVRAVYAAISAFVLLAGGLITNTTLVWLAAIFLVYYLGRPQPKIPLIDCCAAVERCQPKLPLFPANVYAPNHTNYRWADAIDMPNLKDFKVKENKPKGGIFSNWLSSATWRLLVAAAPAALYLCRMAIENWYNNSPATLDERKARWRKLVDPVGYARANKEMYASENAPFNPQQRKQNFERIYDKIREKVAASNRYEIAVPDKPAFVNGKAVIPLSPQQRFERFMSRTDEVQPVAPPTLLPCPYVGASPPAAKEPAPPSKIVIDKLASVLNCDAKLLTNIYQIGMTFAKNNAVAAAPPTLDQLNEMLNNLPPCPPEVTVSPCAPSPAPVCPTVGCCAVPAPSPPAEIVGDTVHIYDSEDDVPELCEE